MFVFRWSYHFLSVYKNIYKTIKLRYNACKGNETAFTKSSFHNPTKGFPLQSEHSENNPLFLITILFRMGWEPLLHAEIMIIRTCIFIVSFTSAFILTSIVSGPYVTCKHALQKYLSKHNIGNGTVTLIVGN
jgi:hypothetical protein